MTKPAHTPESRCTKCTLVHEADSTAGTSFMGVELCLMHKAAPMLLEAAIQAVPCLGDLMREDLTTDDDEDAYQALKAAIAAAEGEKS